MMIWIVLLAVIAALVIFIATRPPVFRVSRALAMNAPASAIYPHINSLAAWNAWSPWAKMDPHCKTVFEGSPEGKGCIMHWDGNKDVGKGSLTITESVPNERVEIQLDFLKPFKGTSYATLALEPQASQTLVTWSMHGRNNFIGKALSCVMNCEKMVGGQYQKGLENIRAIVEKAA